MKAKYAFPCSLYPATCTILSQTIQIHASHLISLTSVVIFFFAPCNVIQSSNISQRMHIS